MAISFSQWANLYPWKYSGSISWLGDFQVSFMSHLRKTSSVHQFKTTPVRSVQSGCGHFWLTFLHLLGRLSGFVQSRTFVNFDLCRGLWVKMGQAQRQSRERTNSEVITTTYRNVTVIWLLRSDYSYSTVSPWITWVASGALSCWCLSRSLTSTADQRQTWDKGFTNKNRQRNLEIYLKLVLMTPGGTNRERKFIFTIRVLTGILHQ